MGEGESLMRKGRQVALFLAVIALAGCDSTRRTDSRSADTFSWPDTMFQWPESRKARKERPEESPEPTPRHEERRDHIYFVGLSANGERAVSADHRMLRIWDTRERVPSERAAAGPLCVWDASGRTPLRQFDEPPRGLIEAISPDGRYALLSEKDGPVHLWEPLSEEEPREMEGARGRIRSASFTPNGRLLIMSCSDGTLRLWDIEDWKEEFCLVAGGLRGAVSISPDGTRALSGGGRRSTEGEFFGVVCLWDLDRGALSRRWAVPEEVVSTTAFSPDGERFLSYSYDSGDVGSVRLWDRDGEELNEFRAFGGLGGKVMAFLPDGRRAVLGIYLFGGWDTRSLVPMSDEPIPDEAYMFHALELWDVETGGKICEFSPPRRTGKVDAYVTQVAMTPNGRYLLSGGRWFDQTYNPGVEHPDLLLWRLPDEEELQAGTQDEEDAGD